MKSFNKFFSVLTLLAVSVTACQIADEHLNQGTVLEVTGVIAGDSRVTYQVDGDNNTITPSWAKGDSIIGFDDLGNTFTFTVSSISAGIATFNTGGYSPTGSVKNLYAIYAPGVDESEIDAKTLSVNLDAQNGVLDTNAEKTPRTPALMCATATVNGSKVLFTFTNQTAIIGVKQFKLQDVAAETEVTSMTLNGVITAGTFSVDGESGELTLTPAESTSSITATGTWTTNDSGLCTTGVYFAAIPTSNASLSLDATAGGKNYINVTAIDTATLSAGGFYYMNKLLGEPEASVTIDGLTTKYMTIGEAWSAANAATSPATVKLLQDCEAEAMLALNDSGTGAVTLDLNGRTLNGPANGRTVEMGNGRSLTIMDSTSDDPAKQGTIKGSADAESKHTVWLTAEESAPTSLVLLGGNLIAKASNSYALYLGGYSTATLTAGTLTSDNYIGVCKGSNTSLTLDAPTITAKNYAMIIYGGSVDISRGIYHGNTYALNGCGNSTIKTQISISGGTFESESNTTVFINRSNVTCNVSGGYFKSNTLQTVGVGSDGGNMYVTGGYHSRAVQAKYAVDDDKNEYVNLLNADYDTKADYPFAIGLKTDNTVLATVTQGDYSWEHAAVEGAFINANARAAVAAATDTKITLEAGATASATLNVNSGNVNGFTLDLNGHTISATGVSPLVSAASAFTLMDSDGAGELSTTGNVALSVTAGTTTVNSGSLVGAVNAALVAADATLNVNEGYFYGAEDGDDISAAEGAAVSLAAGWYRNEPSSDYLASGTAAISGTQAHNERTYNWTIGVETAVATVNGVEYASLGTAAAAANAYGDNDETVTITLLDDIKYDSQIDLTNINGKPIVLDLNGCVLSTETQSFITTSAELTITDNGSPKGMLTSGESKVLDLTSSGAAVTLDGCVIEGTKAEGNDYTDALIDMSSAGTLAINDAQVYTTDSLTVLRAYKGTTTITDSELSSGTESAGWYVIFGTNSSTVNMTSGSLYTSGTGNSSTFHIGSVTSVARMTVASGCYLYSNGRVVSSGNKSYYAQFTLNGGFYNKMPSVPTNGTGSSTPSYGEGLSMQAIDPAATHTHAKTGETLNYGYQVKETPIVYVADVNGEKFTDFADAVSAANAYDGAAGTVTLTLLDDVEMTHVTFNNSSKDMKLDINGHTLSGTDSAAVRYTVSNTFNIVDNGAVKGEITSTKENVVAKGGSTAATINITGCTITSSAPGGNYYSDAVVYLNNAKATMNITNCVIYSTGALTGTSINQGKAEITNSEISSGTSSTGLVGVCAYNSTASVTINSGCFYTSNTTSSRPAAYAFSGKFTIKGGYFFGGNTSIRTAYYGDNQFENQITVKGGYFNCEPLVSGHTPTYVGCSLEPAPASKTYTHSITKESLSFTYQAAPTEGAAEAAASLSEAVASYGAPVSGGVKFLRK